MDCTQDFQDDTPLPAFSPTEKLEIKFGTCTMILLELPQGAIWQHLYNGESEWLQFERADTVPEAELPAVEPELVALYGELTWGKVLYVRRWQLWRTHHLAILQQKRIASTLAKMQTHGDASSSPELRVPPEQPWAPVDSDERDQGYWSSTLSPPVTTPPSVQLRLSMRYHDLFMLNNKMDVQDLPRLAPQRERDIQKRSPAAVVWERRFRMWTNLALDMPRFLTSSFHHAKIRNHEDMFKRTCDWKFSDRTRDLVLREDVDTTEQLPEIPEVAIWQYVYDGEENMRIFIKQDRTPASKLPPVDPRLATMYYKPSHSKISFIRRWQLWRDQYLRKLQQRRFGAELQADIHQGKATSIDIELKWPSKLPQNPDHLDQEEWEDRQKKSSLSYFMVNDNTKIADLPELPHESRVHYKDVSPARLVWLRRRQLWDCVCLDLPRQHYAEAKVFEEPGALRKVCEFFMSLLRPNAADHRQARSHPGMTSLDQSLALKDEIPEQELSSSGSHETLIAKL